MHSRENGRDPFVCPHVLHLFVWM
ncbi:MAG: hypothetical protein QG577_2775, partial [Thermodesulfobacteriota bacterium]|nr:hypothetical protein [Thermodesulfobacteriota bacterium]